MGNEIRRQTESPLVHYLMKVCQPTHSTHETPARRVISSRPRWSSEPHFAGGRSGAAALFPHGPVERLVFESASWSLHLILILNFFAISLTRRTQTDPRCFVFSCIAKKAACIVFNSLKVPHNSKMPVVRKEE